ncbi:MAG: hypothetical protein HY042_02350 [Spirochaetia bacterium]|nr:hypothetical protein [Spirochaetia bacterium]
MHKEISSKNVPATKAIYLLVFMVGASCFQKTATIDHPVPYATFAWGTGLRENETRLGKDGWSKDEAKDETVTFVQRMAKTAVETAPDHKAPEAPYRITLFFNKDRLIAVRMVRRDAAQALDAFSRNTLFDYALTIPVKQKSKPAETTPAGNRIARDFVVYEKPDSYVRVIREHIEAAEKDMAKGVVEELECMIFSRQENQGITAEALLASAEKD